MAMAIQLQGYQKVLDIFGRKARAVQKFPQIVVGYSASYATYVHEDLQAMHANGQAKFLETPVRTMEAVLRADIIANMKDGSTLEEALLAAAEKLKLASQALCPVDTGVLRDSAYARVDK